MLIKNVVIVNENELFPGSVLVKNGKILSVLREVNPDGYPEEQVIDGGGDFLLPGVIDDQVHFRDPGLTHKADIETESRAAVAGGVTSFMDMPNTVPNTVTQELLEEKYMLASKKSLANYSFYMGATNDNLAEVLKTDISRVCGVKVFMGSSTGNMLVDDAKVLEKIFKESPMLIATHCEDENTIRANIELIRNKYGDNPPIEVHPLIRSADACYRSSSLAVELATKHNARLHVLHVSTAKELSLFYTGMDLSEKRITSEACIHHLWFNDGDYKDMQWRIKWNPAVKTKEDPMALMEAVLDGRIDVIATDHAPHTLAEKKQSYFKAPSGGPLVQHALPAMMELYHQGKISVNQVVEKMCHAPAKIFQIEKRGFIRPGYWADMVLIGKRPFVVDTNNIYYKCGWSPFEGQLFTYGVGKTFVNGNLVYNQGIFDTVYTGERLLFNRK